MADLQSAFLLQNGDHIKSDVTSPIYFLYVLFGTTNDGLLLAFRDEGFGLTIGSRSSGLYFNKNKQILLLTDQIDLRPLVSVVSIQHMIALFF